MSIQRIESSITTPRHLPQIFGTYHARRHAPLFVRLPSAPQAPPDPVEHIYRLCTDGAYSDISALLRPIIASELGVRYVAKPWALRDQGGTVTTHESWYVRHDPAARFSVLKPECDTD